MNLSPVIAIITIITLITYVTRIVLVASYVTSCRCGMLTAWSLRIFKKGNISEPHYTQKLDSNLQKIRDTAKKF